MAGLERLAYDHLGQEVYQTVLNNGLKLVILPKPGYKETVGLLQVAYGGVDTEFAHLDKVVKSPYGLAHFLEHQMFEHDGKGDFSQLFTSLGSDSNAFTSLIATTYYFSGLDKVQEALLVLQDLVSQARFTDQSITKEKAVITQEIDMYQDDPDYQLYSGLLRQLFPKTPLSEDIAGTREGIAGIDKSDLMTAFEAFYQPQFMTLLVAGDVAPNEIYRWVKDKQEACQALVNSPVKRAELAYHSVVKKDSMTMDVGMPKLGVGFRLPIFEGSLVKYRVALRLYLNMLLGWTSKTYQDWYDSGRIDDSFDIQIEVNDRFQYALVLLDTKEPITMAAKIKQAVKKVARNKDVSEEHLFTLKKEIYGDFVASLDRLDDLAVTFLEHAFGQESFFDFPDHLTDLTLSEVLALGQEAFKRAEIAEFTIFPS